MRNASQYNPKTKTGTFARAPHFGEVGKTAKVKNDAPFAYQQDLTNADGMEFAMNTLSKKSK